MKKRVIGWKVLSKQRESARAKNWLCVSDVFRIYYPKNKLVKPTFKGSKIFFFDTYENANMFKSQDEIVVQCIAYNVTRPKNVCKNTYIMEEYWHKKIQKKSTDWLTMKPVNGTLFAESIKCLE